MRLNRSFIKGFFWPLWIAMHNGQLRTFVTDSCEQAPG
jgi:hypothetical protein